MNATAENGAIPGRKRGGGRGLPAVLLLCAATVAFWEIMAARSRMPREGFDPGEEEFADFAPELVGWDIARADVEADHPEAPNLFALRLSRNGRDSETGRAAGLPGSMLIRLVHGYNMRDCMRLKGYSVEEIGAERAESARNAPASLCAGPELRRAGDQRATLLRSAPGLSFAGQANNERRATSDERRIQVWRLVSDAGDRSIWVSAILRATDFGGTELGVEAMDFPRVIFWDVADWNSTGLRRGSFRHPIRNLTRFIKSRWNGSRGDLLTFLRLRQPAWASRDYLTFLAASTGGSVAPDAEAAVKEEVTAVHRAAYLALVKWRAGRVKPGHEY